MATKPNIDISVYNDIPEEDRLYPLPSTCPAELCKAANYREFNIAIGMGAKRLPKASFLVVPKELDKEKAARLRLRFGGAQCKRKREEALSALRHEREMMQVVEQEARRRAGPEARVYLYTVPGEEGEFAVETMKKIAKEHHIAKTFDGERRLFYVLGEEAPEPLRRFVSDEAKAAYGESFGAHLDNLTRRHEEIVAGGVEQAQRIVAGRQRGIILSDPARDPRQFAQDVLVLSEVSARVLQRRIGETVEELRKQPDDETLQRGVRVALAIMTDACERGPTDVEIANVGASRNDLPAEVLGGAMPEEARLIAKAYGWDKVQTRKAEPVTRVVEQRQKKPSGRGFSMFGR